jgi:hypothetical protein
VLRKHPRQYHVGDAVRVRLYPSGLIVEAEIKAVVEQATGRKYQVASGQLTALISPDQISESTD